ncbi:MAG: DUF4339 domain-containing protein [Planctomycetes bacterium]|nr:DUF4339 domain-containing protein [Planctomycetota bacterium]
MTGELRAETTTWLVERHGRLLGPFSLDQMRGLVVSGQLRSMDRVLREGSTTLLQATAVPELMLASALPAGALPVGALPAVDLEQMERDLAMPPRPAGGRSRKRLGLGIGIAVAVGLAAGLYFWNSSRSDDDADLSITELPAWFQHEHRVLPARGKKVVALRGLGMMRPPPGTSRPDGFTRAWFDRHFTHYLDQDAFIHARPRIEFQSDGKIAAGTKVLLGKELGEAALICVCSETGRPINMFVRVTALRLRSKGPPPAKSRRE